MSLSLTWHLLYFWQLDSTFLPLRTTSHWKTWNLLKIHQSEGFRDVLNQKNIRSLRMQRTKNLYKISLKIAEITLPNQGIKQLQTHWHGYSLKRKNQNEYQVVYRTFNQMSYMLLTLLKFKKYGSERARYPLFSRVIPKNFSQRQSALIRPMPKGQKMCRVQMPSAEQPWRSRKSDEEVPQYKQVSEQKS